MQSTILRVNRQWVVVMNLNVVQVQCGAADNSVEEENSAPPTQLLRPVIVTAHF